MKNKLIIFITIFSILILPSFSFANEIIVSPWAVLDITDSEKTGILPLDWSVNDFTRKITKEELREIIEITDSKLKSENLKINSSFQKLNSFSSGTREEVLIELYNLFGKYEDKISSKSYIEYLLEKKILKGSGNSLNLNKPATVEDTLIFFNRALIELYERKDLTSKGILYKIENKGKTVYILGSIHIGKTSMYPMSAKILAPFYSADKLYIESNSLSDSMDYINKNQVLSKGDITSYLEPSVVNKLSKLFEENNISKDTYFKLNPWSLYGLISNIEMDKNLSPVLGVDRFFLEKSILLNIPIGELEEAKSQIDLLKNFPEEKYIDLISDLSLNYSERKKTSNSILNSLIDSWTSGDIKNFTNSIENNPKEFSDYLIKSRNDKFANKISKILESKDSKSSFIVLGGGHLVGETSVISKLESKGYKVERIK